VAGLVEGRTGERASTRTLVESSTTYSTRVLRGRVPDLDPERVHARRIAPFIGSLIEEKLRRGR
jgi:hypothetical protein